MNALEVIQAASAADLVDEDGERVVWKPLPGLSSEAIAGLEGSLGFKLPQDLRDLLPHCAGVEGPLEGIDFTGRTLGGFGKDDIFPRNIPIAHDGSGNYWVLDVTPESASIAAVFFACHDAPVILYQADSIAAFLSEVVRKYQPPHQSLIDDVHEDRLFEVWRKNPGTLTVADAASRDEVLRAFAATLDDRFTIVDLRGARPGMGFSWGRYGPRTEIRRHGEHPVFAYAAPENRSFWSRLTGR
jgi:SMI1 / KNR4 family (SUKH-1)